MPESLEKLSPCTGLCVENVPALAGIGPDAAPSSSIRLIRAKLEDLTSAIQPLTCSLPVSVHRFAAVSVRARRLHRHEAR